MHRFLLILLVLTIGTGAANAQEPELINDGQIVSVDLAVDAEYLDLDENPIETTKVGEEVLEGVAVTNLGPGNAVGVVVEITRSSPYPFTYLGHEVSWDGVNWINNDSSYDPLTSKWTFDHLSAGNVYRLVIHQMAVNTGTAQFTANATSDNIEFNLTNNQDTATINITEEAPQGEAEVGKVPMQPTGAPLALMAIAVSILSAGLVISRK